MFRLQRLIGDRPGTGRFTAATAGTNSTAVTVRSGDLGLVQEVDGRSLFLECQGSGSPTVVLQSGFGNAGDIWSLTDTSAPAVFPALAESNRVCVYDRPGSMITTTDAGGALALADSALPGRSDPAPMPRDAAEVVTELHDLLAVAGVPGPFVLVGHSLGGTFDVLYARTYPDEVSGLVVIDSPLPPNRDPISPQTWESVRVMGLDQSLVPGYQLESYDLGNTIRRDQRCGRVAGYTRRRRSAGRTVDGRRPGSRWLADYPGRVRRARCGAMERSGRLGGGGARRRS